ncbi:unnamed protein product, partial [Nesidiocoris tenuis]
MYWLIGRQSTMTIGNKLLLYNQVLKPVWSYGAQLWGCTAPTNRQIIQRFQNSVQRCITDAPWCFQNDALHRELNVDSVDQVIKQRVSAHLTRLRDHLKEEAVKLLDVEDLTRRLKRTKPHELAWEVIVNYLNENDNDLSYELQLRLQRKRKMHRRRGKAESVPSLPFFQMFGRQNEAR